MRMWKTKAAQAEAGTIQYGWFRSKDPSVFVVIEEYVDEDAAFAHNRACAPLLDRFAKTGERTNVQVHGQLGPDLSAWVESHPEAHSFRPLSE
jgi:hypothetical protein